MRADPGITPLARARTHLPPSVGSTMFRRSKEIKARPPWGSSYTPELSGPLWRSNRLARSTRRRFFSASPVRPRAARMPHMLARRHAPMHDVSPRDDPQERISKNRYALVCAGIERIVRIGEIRCVAARVLGRGKHGAAAVP